MAADGKTPPTHPQGGGGNIMCTCSIFVCRHKNNDMSTLLGHVYTYIPTDNTWLQMVRPPQPTHRGGAGTLCVHVVSLCADTKTMTCRPCWDTHILTYQQTDRQTHRHTYINQYKHIVIPIHGCICVTYPPFGGGGWGGTRGGWIIYVYLHTCII